MAKMQITLPAMGEGVIEAEVTRWLVSEGQAVKADEPLVEVATDKVDNEIPAPVDGILQKILISEGETSKIGQVLAIITTDDVQAVPEDRIGVAHGSPSGTGPLPTLQEKTGPVGETGNGAGTEPLEGRDRYLAEMALLSPVVRKMAREHQISPAEIEAVQGTGMNGRITRKDLEHYLERRSAGTTGTHTRIVMDRMRKKIADHTVYSRKIAPHVTSFVESDVTDMMSWRNLVKDDFEARSGQKLTVTTLIMEAVVKALKEYPAINVSVEGYTIIQKQELNIGMATALPDGNLVVPVIREADKLNLAGLAAAVNDLAERARNNELKPEEVTGGTFTVTNLGNFGNIAGTPIINQPEVAILAAGAIRKMPAVVSTPDGDAIGIRQMMILSLAYDHRVVDGALGGSFLRSIGNHLQNFDIQRIV